MVSERDVDVLSISFADRMVWCSKHATYMIHDWGVAETDAGPVLIRIDGALVVPVPMSLHYLSDNPFQVDRGQAAFPWPDLGLDGLHKLAESADVHFGAPHTGALLHISLNHHIDPDVRRESYALAVERYPKNYIWGERDVIEAPSLLDLREKAKRHVCEELDEIFAHIIQAEQNRKSNDSKKDA